MSNRFKWQLALTDEDKTANLHRFYRAAAGAPTRVVMATFDRDAHIRDADTMDKLTRKSARRQS